MPHTSNPLHGERTMRPRTLIEVLAATAVLALGATAALELSDRAQARATYDEPETSMLAAETAEVPLAEVPAVVLPDAPDLHQVELPTEPLVRPELEPMLPPEPARKPWTSAGFLTVATHVPDAPTPVALPDAPVLTAEPDLSEGLIVPALAPAEVAAPFPAVASRCCLAAAGAYVPVGAAGC